jgi:riboflavin synthase
VFTGIVSAVGTLVSVKGRGDDLKRLRIASSYTARSIAIGASISINGACLTVVAKGAKGKRNWFEVEAGAETLARTTAGEWSAGRKLNLERALKAGEELGGHLVTGHIDGVAVVRKHAALKDMARLVIRAPSHLSRFIVPKGSVALDGISLTVNAVEGADFSVFIIPHTFAVTAWKGIAAGTKVNLEVDLIARYVVRLAEARQSAVAEGATTIGRR